MSILRQLGVFGWKLPDENLVLASLLTGDPLLLIGNHGCAKTHVAPFPLPVVNRMGSPGISGSKPGFHRDSCS